MHSVEYVYDDENGGVVTKYDFGEDGAIGMFYDSLNRVNNKHIRRTESNTAQDWEVFYTYKPGSEANQTTSLVSQIQYKIGTSGLEYYTLNYQYDNLGNITKITDGGGNTVGRYMYDNMNQLVFEEVYPAGGTPYVMLYEYDTYGNIRKSEKYSGVGLNTIADVKGFATLIGTETYTYGDSTWKDMLTAYNGTAFTYDASGNPTKYYNGRSYTLTWENGRQLANAIPSDTFVHFEYNADGIRTEKRVSKTYNMYYRLDGDTIIEMKKVAIDGSGTTERYVMAYGENDNPFSISYYSSLTDSTPDTYYYVLNIQGDILQLRDSSNNVACNYTYDAWGKVLSVTNASGTAITDSKHIANVNPFRYRGYYYDVEIGFYYCNSRYYDPQTRRFINADGFVSTGQGFAGYNMFAYCLNNPVGMVDKKGYLPKCIKALGKSIMNKYVKPTAKKIKQELSKIDLTYSNGYNLSGSFGVWAFDGQIGISADTEGNVGLQASYNVSITTSVTPSASITTYRTTTNAPNIKKLDGEGYQTGASSIVPIEGFPLAVGCDLNFIPDTYLNTMYFGNTTNTGIGFGQPGAEFHCGWGYTKTLYSINIFDVTKNIYKNFTER